MSESNINRTETSGTDSSEYTLEVDVNMMNVLMALDGKKSAEIIADITGFPLTKLQEILKKLKQLGLVKSSVSKGPVLSSNDIDLIVNKLTRIIGPIAKTLVEDVVNDIGYKQSGYPVGSLDVMVDKLSQEIDDGNRRKEFQKSILSSRKINGTKVALPFSNDLVLSSNDVGLIVNKLTRIVGPAAATLVEHVTDDIGYKKTEYPVGQFDVLIDKLSQEIDDSGRRQEFQESIKSSIEIKKMNNHQKPVNPFADEQTFAISVWSMIEEE